MDITVYSRSNVVRIILIYRPPCSKKNKFTVSQFFAEFSTLIEDTLICSHRTLLLGNFNFHIDNNEDLNGSKFVDILTSCSLYQHIDTCTHISNHILDLIITRECDLNFISSFELLHSTISDHACILCKFKLPPPEVEKIYITGRKLLNIQVHVDNLCIDIKEACEEINYAEDDVDVEILSSHMDNTLKTLLDKHAPLTYVFREK